ncbi:MAG: hypothetical protein C4536_05025 [Actinobacteria bacterium]|nr:MAG: hypothetical protein C4536_05025 [Actinomycetota bacterium]
MAEGAGFVPASGYHGFSSKFASYVASAMILGGIVGAGMMPDLSEKVRLRKPFLILIWGVRETGPRSRNVVEHGKSEADELEI